MKLVYLANVRIPTEKAHGIQIMKMCHAFSKLGYEVELLIPRRKNQIHTDPFVYYTTMRNFTITKLPTIDIVGLVPRAGFLIQSLSFLFVSYIYLFNKSYDVLYTRDISSNFFFKDTYIELHSLPKKLSTIYIYLCKRAKKIITINELIKKRLLSSLPNSVVVVARDAVDSKQFTKIQPKAELRDQLHIPQNKKVILYTGHLYTWKGIDTLLAAAKSFDENYLFILLGGTDEDRKAYEKKVLNKSTIMLLPRVRHAVVPSYLQAADVVVLPNSAKKDISKYYTSPLKLFEYMASGVPIVASNLPSIKEIINESCATFFEPDSTDSLTNAIHDCLQHYKESLIKAEYARRIVKNFTWDERARIILQGAPV